MKIFIFIMFFNFFKGIAVQIYKTLFIPKLLSILVITDSSIDFYYYTSFKKNSLLKYDFSVEEQKISSTSEGDMISICYIWDDTPKQVFIIVKNYLYTFIETKYNDYIKLDYLIDRYSVLVLDECVVNKGTTNFCSLFISFINSDNKLEIYKYKFIYNTINYSLLKSTKIDLINSSGQISLKYCDYISCHKAKIENGSEALLCFYENDNSEIVAITLNKDTLDLEKEVKFKKNSGAKNIKSVLFDNNEKVFICYINNNDNIACIIFDISQNIFMNEYKYIEKTDQSQNYFNIDYFSSPNQYILSTYTSENKFEFIIFDENMKILENDYSIKSIAIETCSDQSSLLSITIYYYNNYKIAKKCGNEDFSSNAVSEVSSTKSFSLEQIFITDNLIELPQSTLLTDKPSTGTISSTNINGYLTSRISSTIISEEISSIKYIINTTIPSEEKTTKGSIDSTISYSEISNNFKSTIQSSSIKSDIILTDKRSDIASEIISSSNDIFHDEISTNTKLTILLSDKITTNIKSSAFLSDKIITDTKSATISDESFLFFKDEDINHEGKTIKIRTNKTLEFFINNLEKIIGEVNIEEIYEITADNFKIKISPINYKEFETDTSFINFLECENALRKANNLLPNDTLTEVMLEIDKNDDKSLTNQIEYAVFYGKKQLELSACANNEIEVNYDISNSTLVNFRKISDFSKLGVDILNSKDNFFNDICYPYSENNSDMILKDRISDIYQNYSKCDDNCEYKKIDLNTNLITCKCKIKSEINKDIEPPRLESILLDLVTDSSFGVVKCLNLVFNFHNKLKNIGFWIFAIVILAHIVIIIHYSINTINPINRYIISQMKKYYYITDVYNPIKKKKSDKKILFNIYNNFPINLIKFNKIEKKSTNKESSQHIISIRKKKTYSNNRIGKKLEARNSSLSNKSSYDFSKIKLKLKKKSRNILTKNNDYHHHHHKLNEKQKKIKNITTKIKDTEINKKNDNENDYNLIQICANNSPNNTPPQSNTFLDNYNYGEAIKYDKRTFCRIYYICILAEENMLNIILVNSPLELKSLRICLLIFIYSCDFALNTLFYFNSNISDKYHYNGNNKFFYTIFNNMSISIISSFISLVLLIFFKILTTSKDDIEDLFRKEERKMRKNSNYVVNFIKRKQILMKVYEINKNLKKKIIIFFIIEFSIMLFFFYFVTAFCEVYKQSQIS